MGCARFAKIGDVVSPWMKSGMLINDYIDVLLIFDTLSPQVTSARKAIHQ